MKKEIRTRDKIALALAWIEFQDDFLGYMQAHAYGYREATIAFNACYNAYLEFRAESDAIKELAMHFDEV